MHMAVCGYDCSCTPPVAALLLISFFHLLSAEDFCLFIVSVDSNLRECKKNGKQDFVMLLNPNLELVDFRFSICDYLILNVM